MPPPSKKKLVPALLAVAVVAAGATYAWHSLHPDGPGAGFVSGNGRIEATEVDVSTKLGGRVQDILVGEGDFVKQGQTLAHMQVRTLEAARDEARAGQRQAVTGVATAEAQVAVRESDHHAAQAALGQREADLDAAERRLARTSTLVHDGASSAQELDDDRARARSVAAAVAATRAQVAAAAAGVAAARAQLVGARSGVDAAQATVTRIGADIDDSALVAPRAGRVQYRIAEAGEVLGPGGRVLNLVDLSDVYMTFFVNETAAGRLAMGTEVRIVLDAAPQFVVPASVTFVASTAQFTPKTVETASERQKLMFRVKARIDRELLAKHLRLVKTGLPGVAWVQVDPQAAWPTNLAARLPQ